MNYAPTPPHVKPYDWRALVKPQGEVAPPPPPSGRRRSVRRRTDPANVCSLCSADLPRGAMTCATCSGDLYRMEDEQRAS